MKAKIRAELAAENMSTDKNIAIGQLNRGNNVIENLKIRKISDENQSFSTAC